MDTKSKGATQGRGWLERWLGGPIKVGPSEDAAMHFPQQPDTTTSSPLADIDNHLGATQEEPGRTPTVSSVPTAEETPLVIGKHFFAEYQPEPDGEQPWEIYSLHNVAQEKEGANAFFVSSRENAVQLIEALDRTYEADRPGATAPKGDS